MSIHCKRQYTVKLPKMCVYIKPKRTRTDVRPLISSAPYHYRPSSLLSPPLLYHKQHQKAGGGRGGQGRWGGGGTFLLTTSPLKAMMMESCLSNRAIDKGASNRDNIILKQEGGKKMKEEMPGFTRLQNYRN